MSEQGEAVRMELEKAAVLVGTARRLLNTGTEVDLGALEGKVRFVCGAVLELEKGEGLSLRPGLEALMDDLDMLAAALEHRRRPAAVLDV